jgi:hypothetical protein
MNVLLHAAIQVVTLTVFALVVRRMLRDFTDAHRRELEVAKRDHSDLLETSRAENRRVLAEMRDTYTRALADAIKDHLLAMEEVRAENRKALSDALTHAKSFDSIQEGTRATVEAHGKGLQELREWREEHERRHAVEDEIRRKKLGL